MRTETLTMSDVRGQDEAKAALARAAETGEGVLLIGPPGSGKTMLARRVLSLLPPLSPEEREHLAWIYSAHGLPAPEAHPFRAPHHTVSSAGLFGTVIRKGSLGGRPPDWPPHQVLPGETSLAHAGVLFLDELPEFRRSVLCDMATFLPTGKSNYYMGEDGWVSIPARPRVVVAAMNPCPCGWEGTRRPCLCTPERVSRYAARIEDMRSALPLVVRMGPSKLEVRS